MRAGRIKRRTERDDKDKECQPEIYRVRFEREKVSLN